ncbi:MAG: IS3 family transposase, partial [Pirellulales bacterium]|nr:IS3 family transposase [Pirellulales bacterium]
MADVELDSGVSGGRFGKVLSPAKGQYAVEQTRTALGRDRLSERRTCNVLGHSRNTQRRTQHVPNDEPRQVERIVWL